MSKNVVAMIDGNKLIKQINNSHRAKPNYLKFLQPLIEIDPEKAATQFPQIVNTVKNLTWYNADISMAHLLVMGLSLLDNDSHHTAIKKLVRQYQYEYQSEDMFEHSNQYLKQHGNFTGYRSYSLILKPTVLKALWNHPKLRFLIADWLNFYRYYKRCYGVEVKTQVDADAKKINQIVQLLNGIVNSDQIQLSAYLRNPKQTLTYQQWCQKLNQFDSILGVVGLWD